MAHELSVDHHDAVVDLVAMVSLHPGLAGFDVAQPSRGTSRVSRYSPTDFQNEQTPFSRKQNQDNTKKRSERKAK